MGDTRQVIRLKYVWVIWAAFGLLSACRLYLGGGAVGPPVALASALLLGQVNAHLYFLATIPVLSLADRFQLGHGNRPARFLLHALASVAFSAVVLAAQNSFQLWLGRPAGLGSLTRASVAAAVFGKLDEGVCVYWLAVLAPYAYAYCARRGTRALRPPPPGADPAHGAPGTARARLRPHLLFNTLNTIATLMHEDVEAAEAMLINTSAFLRGAISESQEVPLRFELETLKGYLHLESARYEDGVSVSVDVGPDAEAALVPNMLLLPLAENAIKHGVTRSAFGRRIEVEARREGDRLRIRVSNACDGEGEPPRDGAGLVNTAARLSNFYGPSHRFEAGYSPGGEFMVVIEIPFRVRRPATGSADEAGAPDTDDPPAAG